MKAKQIEKLLTGVMNNFIGSIEDTRIKDIMKQKTFVSGGCIPSMLLNEWVNDYDIYLYDINSASEVKHYFEDKHTREKEKKFHVKLITDNAINISDKIQIITKFVGGPREVTDNFDWQHIKSWYDCEEEKLHLIPEVYQLIVEKELVYTGSQYPLSSLLRLKKYLKKGWNVSTKTIVHIVLDIIKEFNAGKLIVDKPNSVIAIKEFKEEREETEERKEVEDREEIEEVEDREEFSISVDKLIEQLNGVDPLTIQRELNKCVGKRLPVREILEKIN